MKTLILALLFLITFNASALVEIDPEVDDLKLGCKYPIARENGVALALDEIAKVIAYVKNDGETDIAYVKIGENTVACDILVTMTDMPDGSYIYAMRALDTDGRISKLSTEVVDAVVKRILPSLAPMEVLGTAVKRQ